MWVPGRHGNNIRADIFVFSSSSSFPSLEYLRFLVIDEADKLLDYHFNQWLTKLLKAVSSAKTTPSKRGFDMMSLERTLQNLCGHPERFQLLSQPRMENSSKVR